MSTATWKCLINHSNLQRSSHVLSVTNKRAYVFGGELVPREPRDDKVFDIDIDLSSPGRLKICAHMV